MVFYFFMIRPQQKKAKDARKFRESLDKGARVVTIGGLHGKVVEVDEKTVLFEADSNVKLRFEKSAIAMDSTHAAERGNREAQSEHRVPVCPCAHEHMSTGTSSTCLRRRLTGGIGSGKSTVGRILEVLGVPVFDADDEAKRMLNEDRDVRQAVGLRVRRGALFRRRS